MYRPARVSVACAVVLSLVSAASRLPAVEVATLDEDASWIDLQTIPDDAVKGDPAGRFLVYREASERHGLDELWSVALAGGAPTRLSGGLAPGEEVGTFAVSPDGRGVVFTTPAGTCSRRLVQVPVTGGPPIRADGCPL